MDTTSIIEWGGFAVIMLLVFAETGLLLGLVVPGGETLVFTAGLLVSTNTLSVPVTVLLGALIVAGFLGDICGYLIGKKMGRRLYEKEDTWYFKKKYLKMAEDYLHNHSKKSMILGKFLPVIRPFTPVVSGVTKLPMYVLLTVSALACILYMSTFVLAGYFLGNQFPIIQDYIGWILPISIIISIYVFWRQVKKHKKSLLATPRPSPKEREV